MTTSKTIIDLRVQLNPQNHAFLKALIECTNQYTFKNKVFIHRKMVERRIIRSFSNCIVQMHDSVLARELKQVIMEETNSINQSTNLQVEIFPQYEDLEKKVQLNLQSIESVAEFVSQFVEMEMQVKQQHPDLVTAEQAWNAIFDQGFLSNTVITARRCGFLEELQKTTNRRNHDRLDAPVINFHESATPSPNANLFHRIFDEKANAAQPVASSPAPAATLSIQMQDDLDEEYIDKTIIDLRENNKSNSFIINNLHCMANFHTIDSTEVERFAGILRTLRTGIYSHVHFIVGEEFDQWVKAYESRKSLGGNTASFSYPKNDGPFEKPAA